jgi:hypothetical protein
LYTPVLTLILRHDWPGKLNTGEKHKGNLLLYCCKNAMERPGMTKQLLERSEMVLVVVVG